MNELLGINGGAEDWLLLWAARRPFDREARAQIEALLCQGIEWDRLLAASVYQSLLPLLYYRLRKLDRGLVPERVLEALKRAYYVNLLHNEGLREELRRVVDGLDAQGIEVVVLKGAALAWTVYPSPALRPMCDLDLLVHPEEMERAEGVLESLGFRLSPAIPDSMIPFQRRLGGGLTWNRSREKGMVLLDVQHHLIGVDWYRRATRLEGEAIWAAARPLPLEGGTALQLSVEDMLIHLCLHSAIHHAYAWSLANFVDIDHVIAHVGPSFPWQRFVDRVERFRVRTAVHRGLALSRRLLGASVPDGVLDTLAPSGLRSTLLRRWPPLDEGGIRGQDQPVTGVQQVLLHAALVDRGRDLGKVVGGILLPGPEWLRVRYGIEEGKGVGRYRLFHLLRVARSFLRGLRRPLVKSGLE